jgi:hypothetical protein
MSYTMSECMSDDRKMSENMSDSMSNYFPDRIASNAAQYIMLDRMSECMAEVYFTVGITRRKAILLSKSQNPYNWRYTQLIQT